MPMPSWSAVYLSVVPTSSWYLASGGPFVLMMSVREEGAGPASMVTGPSWV
jgi:hypothetical protein